MIKGHEIYKLKLNVDYLDEVSDKEKEEMKRYAYDRCDIYLWRGNLCISSDYAKHLIDTIKGKTFNKIASTKLFIDFKNSAFKSETKKEIETQAPIIISALNTINKNIYDN